MEKSVVIDFLPSSAEHYKSTHAIVAVDVIRASTTVTTALSYGRHVYPARDTDDAFVIGAKLNDPLFAGELGGNVPYGFHLTNSPVQIAALAEVQCGFFTQEHRPIILVSSSGTSLMLNSKGGEAVYIGCLRNYSAVASYIAGRHQRVALLGAGTRGEFREEDQLVCAWIAERLVEAGYGPENDLTTELISRWRGANVEEIRNSRSADYLRRSGQMHDLEFVLHYIDDLNIVPALVNGKLDVVSGTVRKLS